MPGARPGGRSGAPRAGTSGEAHVRTTWSCGRTSGWRRVTAWTAPLADPCTRRKVPARVLARGLIDRLLGVGRELGCSDFLQNLRSKTWGPTGAVSQLIGLCADAESRRRRPADGAGRLVRALVSVARRAARALATTPNRSARTL